MNKSCKNKCKKQMNLSQKCIIQKCKNDVNSLKKKKSLKNNASKIKKCLSSKCKKELNNVKTSQKSKNIKEKFDANMNLGKCLVKNCKQNINSIQKKTSDILNCIEKECKVENQNVATCKINHCKLLDKVPNNLKQKVLNKLNTKN
jgi:hypothetical protein